MLEENKALSRRFYEEVWGNKNLDIINDLFSTDAFDHTRPAELPPDPEGTKAYIGMFLSAFPDVQMTIEDHFAEGDRVVTRWTTTGTHTGELMNIPATGQQITVTGIYIQRIVNGKIVESWGLFDQMGMMQQLGVIPVAGADNS